MLATGACGAILLWCWWCCNHSSNCHQHSLLTCFASVLLLTVSAAPQILLDDGAGGAVHSTQAHLGTHTFKASVNWCV